MPQRGVPPTANRRLRSPLRSALKLSCLSTYRRRTLSALIGLLVSVPLTKAIKTGRGARYYEMSPVQRLPKLIRQLSGSWAPRLSLRRLSSYRTFCHTEEWMLSSGLRARSWWRVRPRVQLWRLSKFRRKASGLPSSEFRVQSLFELTNSKPTKLAL
jgi:hypothetical protein